jgi:hypothetical protein
MTTARGLPVCGKSDAVALIGSRLMGLLLSVAEAFARKVSGSVSTMVKSLPCRFRILPLMSVYQWKFSSPCRNTVMVVPSLCVTLMGYGHALAAWAVPRVSRAIESESSIFFMCLIVVGGDT